MSKNQGLVCHPCVWTRYEEITSQRNHHCSNKNLREERQSGFLSSCNCCPGYAMGHIEPYEGKGIFGKKQQRYCLSIRVIGQIKVLSGQQGQAYQRLDKREGKTAFSVFQMNGQETGEYKQQVQRVKKMGQHGM